MITTITNFVLSTIQFLAKEFLNEFQPYLFAEFEERIMFVIRKIVLLKFKKIVFF